MADALALIQQPALVIGIETDGLFTFDEQRELAAGIPGARLRTIDSPEGHDAFLLQFEQVNMHILDFLNEVLPNIMCRGEVGDGLSGHDGEKEPAVAPVNGSTFGEAEAVEDITAW